MKKKLAVLSTTIMLGLGNVVAIPNVKADTLTRTQIQSGISKANLTISQAHNALAAMQAQVNRVNQAINENNSKIQDVGNKIAETTAVVNQLNDQINVINDRIEKRNNILKERAISLQETGGDVSYLDVLLGATSFKDFVDRINSVATLVQADSNLLQQSQADKSALQDKQAEVTKKLDQLNGMKTELVGMKQQLADQKAQNDAMQAQLQQQAKDGGNQLANLMAENQQMAAAAIQAGISQTNQNSGNQSSSSSAGISIPALSAPQGSSGGSNSGSVDTVIRAGYKYIGNSVYVFGGGRTASDVANGYFDCSGFVHWAFSQAGISVGSSTDSLLGAGRRVSYSSIKPGDLVFFNTYKQNGHVGIYIGGGKFIGSQSSTGVAVASMSNVYWASHFGGVVVRVID